MIGIRFIRLISLIASMLCVSTISAKAQTEIQFWHAIGGELGEKLTDFANRFNASRKNIKSSPFIRETIRKP